MSCPLPLVVEVPAEAIRPDVSLRLCADNTCTEQVTETNLNHFGWDDRWLADDDVDVRLEFVDAADVTVRTVEGSGTLSGGCCKTLDLRLSDDGALLTDR